jgi:hypothetical protein
MRCFDYSFLERGMLPAGLVNAVSAISELKAHENERKNNFPDVFTRLESIAKVQSVKGSNEIEGIITRNAALGKIDRDKTLKSIEYLTGWKDKRNELMHELLRKNNIAPEAAMQPLAADGLGHLRAIDGAVSKLKQGVDVRKKFKID